MRAAGRLSGGIFFTLLPAIVSQGSAVRPSIPAVSLRGAAATLYPVGSHHHQAVPSFTSSLADDLTAGLQPILRNLSAVHNDSAWAFSYRDADVTLDLCAGFSDVTKKTPCSATDDVYAWGSTTKSGTATLILRLNETGGLGLDDPFVPLANPFLKRISRGAADLLTLYDHRINDVTVRHLLQMSSGLNEYDDETIRLYQNTHRSTDLSPEWILFNSNRSFACDPGTCGIYSSTNFVLLGLVIAQATGVADWDKLDQRAWVPTAPAKRAAAFSSVRYGVHGPLMSYTTAEGVSGTCISGYQPVCRGPSAKHRRCVFAANDSDVRSMSSTQGWTCGNLIAHPRSIASFYYELLGPPSTQPDPILSPSSLEQMLSFKNQSYFGKSNYFGYGLGMMNFTSMDWGFADEGLYYGHNGLTYGFGSQQGYNYPLEFAATWVNNWEKWIGPDNRGVPNELYTELCRIVRRHRQQYA